MFLTIEELQQLSGWKRKSKLTQWCDENGIPYVTNRWKQPVVDKNTAFKVLGMDAKENQSNKQINEEGLRKMMENSKHA